MVWNHILQSAGNLLHVAIQFDQLQMLDHLLAEYHDHTHPLLEDRNSEGKTPLLLAASKGSYSALLLLYQRGANLRSVDDEGNTALHLAARKGVMEIIQLLIILDPDLLQIENRHREKPHALALNREVQIFLHGIADEVTSKEKGAINFAYFPPINLVIQGGGPTGIAHIGAIGELERLGALKMLRRVAGTSAGAIMAAFLSCGHTAAEIQKLLQENSLVELLLDVSLPSSVTNLLNYPIIKSRLGDGPITLQKLKELINNLSGRLSDIKNVPLLAGKIIADKAKGKIFGNNGDLLSGIKMTTGICAGEVFREWIEEVIAMKTGVPYCTFGELRKLIEKGKPYKHLHLFSINIGTELGIYRFNSEEEKWDNLIISDAVRCSMSIPLVFKPHILHFKTRGQRIKAEEHGSFIDGGLLYNLPIEAFDHKRYRGLTLGEEDGPVFNRRTLGLSLTSPQQNLMVPNKNIDSLRDLLGGLIQVYYDSEQLIRKEHQSLQAISRVAKISNNGVTLLDFDLSLEGQQGLITSGKKAIEDLFRPLNAPCRDVLSLGQRWDLRLANLKETNPIVFNLLLTCLHLNPLRIPEKWVKDYFEFEEKLCGIKLQKESRKGLRIFCNNGFVDYDSSTKTFSIPLATRLKDVINQSGGIDLSNSYVKAFHLACRQGELFEEHDNRTWDGAILWLSQAHTIKRNPLKNHLEIDLQKKLNRSFSEVSRIYERVSSFHEAYPKALGQLRKLFLNSNVPFSLDVREIQIPFHQENFLIVFKKAEEFFNQSLMLCQKHYGNTHLAFPIIDLLFKMAIELSKFSNCEAIEKVSEYNTRVLRGN